MIAVLGIGIASRVCPLGFVLWDKYLGDALYAICFYLCLAISKPDSNIAWRVVLTAGFVICIECFQLTGIPFRMRQSDDLVLKLISIGLGTKFAWADMLAYSVGIAAASSTDQFVCRMRR